MARKKNIVEKLIERVAGKAEEAAAVEPETAAEPKRVFTDPELPDFIVTEVPTFVLRADYPSDIKALCALCDHMPAGWLADRSLLRIIRDFELYEG